MERYRINNHCLFHILGVLRKRWFTTPGDSVISGGFVLFFKGIYFCRNYLKEMDLYLKKENFIRKFLPFCSLLCVRSILHISDGCYSDEATTIK
jgi:hypothetical protein